MQETRKEQIERLQNEADAIQSMLRGLMMEEAAETMAKAEAQDPPGYELPVVGYLGTSSQGTKVAATTRDIVKAWLGDDTLYGAKVESLTTVAAAQEAINELSDMVTSLSETQWSGSLDQIIEAVSNLPVCITETSLSHNNDKANPTVSNRLLELINTSGIIGTPLQHFLGVLPSELNENTKELVVTAATALAMKLRKSEVKYEYADGWADTWWADECKMELRRHLEKGDPLDVAIYALFLWYHKQSTSLVK